MPNHGCTFAYIDFQPVVELDLKDSRQVHFSTFWRNRSNFKIARNMTRRLEEASNNNVRDSNGHLLSEDLVVVESRSGGECCNLYQCRYLCLYANKSLHADLHLLAGHQIYMHQIYIWPSDIYASVSMRWETGHDANSNLHFFVVSLFYSSSIHIDFICPLFRAFPRFWLRNVPIYQVGHFLQ